MGFTADATGGIGLPIAIAGVIAAVGVAVLLPMTRHPVPLPTYIGPPGAPPPPRPAPLAAEVPRPLVPQLSAAAPLASPSSRPLAPRPLAAGGPNGKPAVPMIRPVDDPVTADPSLAPTTADPLPLSAPLRGTPPEVFWPVPADGAAQRNGLETSDLVVDVADEERDEARRN